VTYTPKCSPQVQPINQPPPFATTRNVWAFSGENWLLVPKFKIPAKIFQTDENSTVIHRVNNLIQHPSRGGGNTQPPMRSGDFRGKKRVSM